MKRKETGRKEKTKTRNKRILVLFERSYLELILNDILLLALV